MEPIKINIEVEVGLKQTTIDTIRQLFGAQIVSTGAAVPEAPAPKEEPKRKAKKENGTPAPIPEPEAVEEPKEGPAPASALAADDDLPPDDAPAPAKKTPTEHDARQAVQAARKRHVTASTIKDFMKVNFNIASSVECPPERRQELIDGLNKLTA